MKKILALLTTTPLLITSCFTRPNDELFLKRYDGHVEGVVYNNDNPLDANIRTRADVKVVNGLFEHVLIERDKLIGREWITIASWDPTLDNFGSPTLKSNAQDLWNNQYTATQFNTEGLDYVINGNDGSGFWYSSESMYADYNDDAGEYFYPIGAYALFIRNDILYSSIAGSITSRQTYEAITDLSPYKLANGDIDPQYLIGDVFDWRVNQTLSGYGYAGDIAETPFTEQNGSITLRGTFRDIEPTTTLEQYLRMIGLDHTQDSEIYGRHSNNGWVGNYGDINNFFYGKNVDSFSSLWDRVNIGSSIPGEETIKDVNNTIAGATVSMSRENGAFQNALVKLGRTIELDGILWE